MFQKLKKFFSDKKSKPKEDIQTVASQMNQFVYIDKILHNLAQNRTQLSIRFPSSSDTFASMLLSVDNQKNYIILDEIAPTEGHFRAINGTPFTISTREQGVFLSFDSKVVKHVEDNNLSYYHLPYPHDVKYTQRRKAYRVPLQPHHGLRADIFLPNQPRISADVTDISVSGLRLLIKHNITSTLDSMKYIDQCLLVSSDMKPTRFSLEIKDVYYDIAKKATILCCQFLDINADEQLFLIELVGKLQQNKIMQRFSNPN